MPCCLSIGLLRNVNKYHLFDVVCRYSKGLRGVYGWLCGCDVGFGGMGRCGVACSVGFGGVGICGVWVLAVWVLVVL